MSLFSAEEKVTPVMSVHCILSICGFDITNMPCLVTVGCCITVYRDVAFDCFSCRDVPDPIPDLLLSRNRYPNRIMVVQQICRRKLDFQSAAVLNCSFHECVIFNNNAGLSEHVSGAGAAKLPLNAELHLRNVTLLSRSENLALRSRSAHLLFFDNRSTLLKLVFGPIRSHAVVTALLIFVFLALCVSKSI